MVGRKPAPLLPKRKKTTGKSKTDTRGKKERAAEEDEDIALRPSTQKKRRHRLPSGVQPSAPQQQLSAEDKRLLRRRRQRRRLILRIVALVAVCGLALVVWFNRSSLAPDKVWVWVQDLVGGGTGSYPVDLSGTGARRLERVDHYTVVLTDSHLIYLNDSGAEVSRYGCTYSRALLRAEGKYVLVAEQEGQRLHLTTRNKSVLEWEAEAPIRAVSLNAKGQVVVLTDGPQGYAVQLKVYDAEGEVLYTRSSNRTVTDVALSPDGTAVSLAAVEAVDGTLNTRLEVFALDSAAADPKSTHTVTDTLLYRVAYLSDGTLAAVHEQGVVLMGTDGRVTPYQSTGMHLLGYAVGGDTVALALRPYGSTAGGRVEVLSAAGTAEQTLTFEGEFRHLSGCAGRYALLTDRFVQSLSTHGIGIQHSVQTDGLQAVCSEEQVMVMGLNQLEAFPLNG